VKAFLKFLLSVGIAGMGSSTFASENLDMKELSHIQFDKIPATNYSTKDGILQADVNNSSSILIRPFDAVKSVKAVSFLWKAEGGPAVKNAEQEKEKKGDDVTLRVGLMLNGDKPTVPFFAPSWVKATEKVMKLPSDKIINLSVATKNSPGTEWESPYSDSITYLSLASQPAADGWQTAETTFAKPLNVVGYWIIADGDDTKSKFTVSMKNLEIK
jgi:hypothetical protein